MAILAYDEVMLREPNLLIPRRQPVGNVRIDNNNTLTLGLVGCWLFSKSRNSLLAGFGESTFAGGAKIERGCLVLDGAGDYLQAVSPIVTMPLSIGAVVNSATTSAGGDVIAMVGSNAGSAWDGWYFALSSTVPNTQWLSANNNSFDGLVTLGLPRYPVAMCGSAQTGRLQQATNGIIGAADTSFTDPGTIATPLISIGASARVGAGSDPVAEIPLVCVWNRALSDAELITWSADPFQIFVPA